MKTKFLFIIILLSILIPTYFVYEYLETSQKNNNLKTNCATYFDMMYESWTPSNSSSFASVLQSHTFLANSFRTDKCATSINEWAYLSEHENVIWNSGLDWNEISYIVFDGDRAIIYD